MNNPLTINLRAARRVAYAMAAVLLFATGLPLLNSGSAGATQLSSRSITMSDSSISGTSITSGVGSGTNVTYQITFTATHQASSMVIDFCALDPIINDNCGSIAAMDTTTATLTNVTSTGQVGVAGNNWSVTDGTDQVKLADDGVSGHDIQAGSTQTFELNGITNTTTVGTFYARMYTYADNSWGSTTTAYVSPTSIGDFKDYGGIALSTTNVITITARVQESLTFCVTAADPNTWSGPDCTATEVAANPPALTLGHGSPTLVLDSSRVDAAPVWTQLSTNATHGAVINMRNSNLTCGGLSADNGATCAIPPINAGATGVSAMAAGTAAFGLFVQTYTPTVGIGTIGSVAPTANYNDGTHVTIPTSVWYGMDDTTANNNVTSTYGSTVASTTGPVYRADDEYYFAATSALTTPAGIYTANLTLVATGTF